MGRRKVLLPLSQYFVKAMLGDIWVVSAIMARETI
jgi:hypothetical protein